MTPTAILSILIKTDGVTAATGDLGRLDHKARDAGKSGDSMARTFKRAGALMAGAFAADKVVDGLKGVIRAATDSEVSNSKMQTQVKALGLSYRAHAKEIDKVIQKTSALSGLDDEDLQDSFTNIVRVTGDVNQALKLSGLAADFARAKHIDVAKAGELVGKVAGGNTGILSRYGIKIKDGATATEALGELQKKFAGQAEAYGKTAAGAQERFGVAVENLQEKLGAKLLPIVTDVTLKVTDFIEQMESGKGAGGRFAAAVGGGFEKVKSVAAAVWPVLRDGGEAALGLLRTGFARLKAIIEAATPAFEAIKSKVVEIAPVVAKFVTDTYAKVKETAASIFTFIRDWAVRHRDEILGAWHAIRDELVAAYDTIATPVLAALSAVRDAVTSAFTFIRDWVKSNATGILDTLLKIAQGIGRAYSVAKDTIITVFGAIKTAIGAAIGFISGWIDKHRDDINAFAQAWQNIAKIVLTVVGGMVLGLKAAFENVLVPVMKIVLNVVKAVWPGIRMVIEGALKAIGGIINVFSGIFTGDFKRIWEGVKDIFEGALKAVIGLVRAAGEGLFAAAKGLGGLLKDGIVNGVKGLAGLLKDAVESGFKGAVNLVAGFINKIIDIINKIPGVNVGHVQGLAEGGKFQGFARGGAFARTGGIVNSPITLMGEEAPRHPEFVIPTNPAYRKRAQGLAMQAANAVGLKRGGVFGAVGNVFDSAVKLASSAGGFLAQLAAKGAGAVTGMLPSTGSLPTWLQGVGTYALEHVGSWIKGAVSKVLGGDGGKGAPAVRLAKMIGRMNEINAKGYPYVYGGGHGSFAGPYDCSGLVSAILNAGGFLGSPITTDGLKVFGESGDGKYVTVGVRGSTGRSAHTMMKLGDRYLESGSGHGAKWTSGWSGGFPIHRHPAGFATGGIYGKFLAEMFDPARVGWGLRKGGVLGSYKSGTSFVPQTGPYMLHRGEAVVPQAFVKGGVNAKTPFQKGIDKIKKANLPPLLGAIADSIKGQTDERRQTLEAQMAAVPTQLDYLNAAIARAGISGDKDAAITAAQGIANLRYSEYQAALATADPRDDIEAAANYKSAQDALVALTDAVTATKDALEEQRKQYETLMAQDYQKKYAVSQSQYGVLAQALTDVVSVRMGSTLGLSLSGLRAAPGSVARV